MKQKTRFKHFGNVGYWLSAHEWLIYQYRPQKSHIGQSLVSLALYLHVGMVSLFCQYFQVGRFIIICIFSIIFEFHTLARLHFTANTPFMTVVNLFCFYLPINSENFSCPPNLGFWRCACAQRSMYLSQKIPWSCHNNSSILIPSSLHFGGSCFSPGSIHQVGTVPLGSCIGQGQIFHYFWEPQHCAFFATENLSVVLSTDTRGLETHLNYNPAFNKRA